MPDLRLSHTTNLGKLARTLEDCTEMERWELQQKLWKWLREHSHFDNSNPHPVRLVR